MDIIIIMIVMIMIAVPPYHLSDWLENKFSRFCPLFQISFLTGLMGFLSWIYFSDITITILVIVISLIVNYFICFFERKRRENFQKWAKLHSWTYDCRKDRIYHRYSHSNRFQRGSNRYAFDILEGTWNKYPAEAFNFHYQTRRHSSQGNSRTEHHYFGIVIFKIESFFPKIQIYEKDIFDKISHAFGFGNINFESVEFSQRFTVCCHDPKFAYDFCHPRMMEYLLTTDDIVIELEGNILAIIKYDGKINPGEIEQSLNTLIQLRELMPNYLFIN